MSNLFPTIMLKVYQEHGSSVENVEISDDYTFSYDIEEGGISTSEYLSVCKYIAYEVPSQNEDGTFEKNESGYIKNPRQWTEYELELATRIWDRGLKTLYVGAGGGRFLFLLGHMGIDVHGIDWEDDAIAVMDLAQADGHIAAGTYQKMDGHVMTFADNSFGTVILPMDIVEQSRDIDALISEAKRVASDWVFVASSQSAANSETEKTDGECTITWGGIVETLPYTAYPIAWMDDKLEELGLTPVRNFQNEYPNVSGEEWFIEAAV